MRYSVAVHPSPFIFVSRVMHATCTDFSMAFYMAAAVGSMM